MNFKNSFTEINKLHGIFLVKLIEKNDGVRILICGSKETNEKFTLDEFSNNQEIYEIISEGTVILEDLSVIYEIYFEDYIAYQITKETLSNVQDDIEKYDAGVYFRIYNKSSYMNYVIRNSIADACFQGEYVHYEICTEWQIIDIISPVEPRIIIHKQDEC